MAKQLNCPMCYPSIVLLKGVKFCDDHRQNLSNENLANTYKVTLQENTRALKRGLVADLTIEQVMMARLYFSVSTQSFIRSEACAYCRQSFATGLDHWEPISSGGGSTVKNVLPCCHVCNVMKNALTGDEFLGVMIDGWKSPVAEKAKQEISLYWDLVNGKDHAVYEYCMSRRD